MSTNWATAANGASTSASSGAGTTGNAIDGNDGTSWACTGGAANQWIRIDLGQARSVGGLRFIQDEGYYYGASANKLQKSDNGTDWTDVLSFSGTLYYDYIPGQITARYWQVLALSGGIWGWNVATFELWDDFGSIIATASSTYSIYTAAGAVDGNDGTIWASVGSVAGAWLKVCYGTTLRTFTGYRLLQNNPACVATTYKLQSSEDNVTWTDVYTRSATAPADETVVLSSPVTTRWLRLLALAGGGSGWQVYTFAPAISTPVRIFTGKLGISASKLGHIKPAKKPFAFSLAGITTEVPVIGQPVIGQKHVLTASSLACGSVSLGTPVIAGNQNLTTNNLATPAPVCGTPGLSQNHSLVANGLACGTITCGQPVLGQTHALTANGLTCSVVLDTPVLVVISGFTAVSLETPAPVLEAPALGQNHTLSAIDLNCEPVTWGPVNLRQEHALTASLDLVAPALGQPELGIIVVFEADTLLTGLPVLGQPALTQEHHLVGQELATGAIVLGRPAFQQVHSLPAVMLVIGAILFGQPKLAILQPTPDERSWPILAENRTYWLLGEDRHCWILSENRTLRV